MPHAHGPHGPFLSAHAWPRMDRPLSACPCREKLHQAEMVLNKEERSLDLKLAQVSGMPGFLYGYELVMKVTLQFPQWFMCGPRLRGSLDDPKKCPRIAPACPPVSLLPARPIPDALCRCSELHTAIQQLPYNCHLLPHPPHGSQTHLCPCTCTHLVRFDNS